MSINLKKKHAEGKIGSKIIKQILRQYFNIGFLKEELDGVLQESVQTLMKQAKDGLKIADDHHRFVDRYKTDWSYLHVMDTILMMLEKGKKY